MLTKEQLDTVKRIAPNHTIGEIAKELGIDRTTLERKLMRHHFMVLQPIRGCQLVPLGKGQLQSTHIDADHKES